MQSKNLVSEINNYAMQNGIILGLFGIISLVVFKWSLTIPFMSTLFYVMLLGSPFLTAYLTMKLRNQYVKEIGKFTYMNGFMHAFFTGFYASIWVALFTFIYLQYFDHGAIFAAYAKVIDTPEMQLYLQQSGLNTEISQISGAQGVQGLVEALRNVGSATYAAMSLYCTLIFGPIFSAIIAFICKKD